MQIKNNKTTNQIKEEFKALYSNLKIDFFLSPHEPQKGNPNNQKIEENLHLSSLRKNQIEGVFMISPEMSVNSLETAFEQNYGLHIQVYRRSGNTWLQTTSTDEWSLSKQNSIGGRKAT